MALNPSYNDVYGRQQFLDRAKRNDYDLIFLMQDTFIVETFISLLHEELKDKEKQPAIIYYFPIDATPKRRWVDAVSATHYPIAYTEYAKAECVKIEPRLANACQVIHHGVDADNFYPLTKQENLDFRADWFKSDKGKPFVTPETFLIVNVNRNQSRKDIMRNFMILDQLKKRGRTNVHLYLHMQQQDVGGDLNEMAGNFDIEFGRDWTCPANFDAHSGVSIEVVNRVYNAADCFISTHTGEGFGLSIIECALTKTPMVIPNNTCMKELWGGNKAYLSQAGSTASLWVMKDMDNERLRPLVDVGDAVKNIERIMDGDLPDVEAAYRYALDHDWDKIALEWEKLFDGAQAPMKAPQGVSLNRAQRRQLEREQRKVKNG